MFIGNDVVPLVVARGVAKRGTYSPRNFLKLEASKFFKKLGYLSLSKFFKKLVSHLP